MWRCFLCDTMTGRLRSEVDIPSFSWTVTVSDCSFNTHADKGTGEGEASGIKLPWGALPGDTPEERGAAVASGRRGLVLCWVDDQSKDLVPIVFGAIGDRTDTYFDTTFSLDSPLTILGCRYCIEEGTYGASSTIDDSDEDEEVLIEGTTTSVIKYTDRSFRGIAASVGSRCTSKKPGGKLPIDWNYIGEEGDHERTYYGYNVANLSCADIWDKLANVTGGPDMQLRPYMYDSSTVRLNFIAGSDADVYIGQDSLHYLSEYNDLSVAHSKPYMRVYQAGAGSEFAQIAYLAEDLSLVKRDDPIPLFEVTHSDTSDDSLAEVESQANAWLKCLKYPLCQVTLTADAGLLPLGDVWPGEVLRVPIDDFPTLPSGDYDMRLMSMKGSNSRMVTLTFDVMEDPTY